MNYALWIQAKNQEISRKRQDVQAKNQEISREIEEVQAQLIVEYQKMIDNFNQLHARKSTAPIYFTIKEDLKKALLARKPREILPQLESIRSILMSPLDPIVQLR